MTFEKYKQKLAQVLLENNMKHMDSLDEIAELSWQAFGRLNVEKTEDESKKLTSKL